MRLPMISDGDAVLAMELLIGDSQKCPAFPCLLLRLPLLAAPSPATEQVFQTLHL